MNKKLHKTTADYSNGIPQTTLMLKQINRIPLICLFWFTIDMEDNRKMKLLWKDHFVDGELIVQNGIISGMKSCDNHSDLYCLPGFFDVHTHGANGLDFNSLSCSSDVEQILSFYASQGVTSVFPTVMTAPLPKMKQQLSRISEALFTHQMIKGIHIEGPFISHEYRGAHREEDILSFSKETFLNLMKFANNKIKYITIAPEALTDNNDIIFLKNLGLVVSLGHSGASDAKTTLCIQKGATSFTHTFNAMAPFTHHQLTISFSALSIPKIYNEVIMDLHHVDPKIILFLLKNKGEDYLVGITDSLACTGLEDGNYSLGGESITKKNGECFITGTTTRAGSCISMLDGLKNYMKITGYPLERAILPFTMNPAKSTNLSDRIGTLEIGKEADYFIMDEQFNVLKTFIHGEQVYTR